ncbi:SPOR domain-containing protein [Gangjinia marincola]|uniref:SPOR domain-containing protein n=2 Tax=Gangjinia marincola TaxID=578463 RepID=A0ABP3XW51_9FLAO
MRLDTHISDLLYRFDCVILPEFGAFLGQRQSARVHHITRAFYPPRKQLSFNSQLTTNDGILANYVATAEGISYENAVIKIQQYVRFLRATLQEQKKLIIDQIGSFSLTEDQTLQFQPSYHLNYLTESFGMQTFTSEAINRAILEEKVIALQPEENTVPIASASQPEPTPNIVAAESPTVITLEQEESNPRRKKPYWRYAAVGLLAIGVAGYSGLRSYSNAVHSHNLAAQQQAEQQLEQEIQEATFFVSSPLPNVSFVLTKESFKYHVIAGAFRVEANAQKKVDQLNANGYENARLVGVNSYGLHQVAYQSFNDRSDAVNEYLRIKREEDTSAWLLTKETD